VDLPPAGGEVGEHSSAAILGPKIASHGGGQRGRRGRSTWGPASTTSNRPVRCRLEAGGRSARDGVAADGDVVSDPDQPSSR